MKLREIFDTEFRNTALPDAQTPSKFKDTKLLGAGYYSTAHQPRNNPYDVHKASRRSFNYAPTGRQQQDNDLDPYYDWVIAIAPYAKSNPYLPRVYVVDKHEDKNKVLKPEYHMEKLLDYEQAQLSVLCNLLYNESTDYDAEVAYVDQIKQTIRARYSNVSYVPATVSNRLIAREIWPRIIRYITHNVRKDPQIQQVIDIIDRLIVDRGYREDMHQGNFMIRMTSIGPHIVFTDPLSYMPIRQNNKFI